MRRFMLLMLLAALVAIVALMATAPVPDEQPVTPATVVPAVTFQGDPNG